MKELIYSVVLTSSVFDLFVVLFPFSLLVSVCVLSLFSISFAVIVKVVPCPHPHSPPSSLFLLSGWYKSTYSVRVSLY